MKFYEFNNYLQKSGMIKVFSKTIDTMIKENVEDEKKAFRILQRIVGMKSADVVDLTQIAENITTVKSQVDEVKVKLKEAMLKFMDAIERSTTQDFFVDTGISKMCKMQPYDRAKELLKQFFCVTKVKDIVKLRDQLGVISAQLTSAKMAEERRKRMLTESEWSLIAKTISNKSVSSEPDKSNKEKLNNITDDELAVCADNKKL